MRKYLFSFTLKWVVCWRPVSNRAGWLDTAAAFGFERTLSVFVRALKLLLSVEKSV